MNYSNHNLRTDLQEWKHRLYKTPHSQLGYQLKFFFNNLESSKQLQGLLNEAILQNPLDEETLERLTNNRYRQPVMDFNSESEHASYCYQFLNYFIQKVGNYNLHNYPLFISSNFDGTKSKIIENYISPIIYFLHDKLDKSNSIIYLLEKYKKRTEWFTKQELFEKYNEAKKSYEQIFEDDLRLFLFDQGIDYPFSTPSSTSGRVDIVGQIETNDPLIIEVKIFDSNKGYKKNRVKGGFAQIVKYANDYVKDVGYLVIFNLDNAELHFNFSKKNNVFPPAIQFQNKVFYMVVINLAIQESASKTGQLKEIEITDDELIKSLDD